MTFTQNGGRALAIAAKIKPNPQQSGAAAVRELRDA